MEYIEMKKRCSQCLTHHFNTKGGFNIRNFRLTLIAPGGATKQDKTIICQIRTLFKESNTPNARSSHNTTRMTTTIFRMFLIFRSIGM
jgi:hypothetical protein